MILHYFVFMTYLRTKLDKIFETRKEIDEINDVIEILKTHLKNKNPN
jgi:hypothetical protein